MTKPNKNVFDLSHDVKLSCNMGQLVPILVQDCVPGDRFHLGADSLLRFAPLTSPVFHKMHVSMHFFFVPNRILWVPWQKFIIQDESTGTHAFPYVIVKADGTNYSPLMDYMGIPNPATIAGPTVDERVSALPFAAYQRIWNDYYRDQNLYNEWPSAINGIPDGDNTGTSDIDTLRVRAYEHDYFTSALPFAQKGNPVTLPLGDVVLKTGWDATGTPGRLVNADDYTNVGEGNVGADVLTGALRTATDNKVNVYDPQGSLVVGSTTINDLRRAYRLQEFLEKNARGGTRMTEVLKVHFGVKSSDARLQRPEYITGTRSPVMVSEVLSTTQFLDSAQPESLPQGNMSGQALGIVNGKLGSYFCEEHGYIIGIMSVMPEPAYFQGIQRHWLKSDPLDWFWPTFANLGEQAIIKKELYAFETGGDDTFGYIPRYAEYKYQQSRVAGDFRTSLLFWHIAQEFTSLPSLNPAFLECRNDKTDRIFAVTDPNVQKLYVHVLNKIKAVRAMPVYGTPMT